ncbi:unnamed protein product [Blepharisma stoltei]|uniref:2TM domain-containing protein n=1 Tax=Blepharisma stoltei TaxID=1481888 RepID=A0AAU9IZ44_9CILI|nr:unnamed protein product [Blepharisma stoltei]
MTENTNAKAWKLFYFWYKETYETHKNERRITKIMKIDERQFLRRQYMDAFVWNGIFHCGILWVLYYWGISSNRLQQAKFIPFPIRFGCIFGVPLLSAYLFFQSAFYNEKIIEIAERYSSEIK